MQIDGAIITEQGVTFAIVIVKPHVTASSSEAAKLRASLQSQIRDFAGIPLILASQDSRGVFEYEGRHDIVDFLASIDSSRIPWSTYTIY
jgi:hypothetical protein